MLMAHALLAPETVPITRIELSMLVATQVLNPIVHSGIRPVPWPGARQFVSTMLTSPHGSRSGPVPNSMMWILHSVAWPVLVTTAYQVMLLAMTLQVGASVCAGVPPLTETSFWQAMLAGTTIAT